ncbi:MAG TPA: hypothetical protein VFJ58_25160 [Armatimonadota bacterium]|nr:hypothetical protein [Armatimonadota bacterium]
MDARRPDFPLPSGRVIHTERTYDSSFAADLKEGSKLLVLYHRWRPAWNRPLPDITDVEIIPTEHAQ